MGEGPPENEALKKALEEARELQMRAPATLPAVRLGGIVDAATDAATDAPDAATAHASAERPSNEEPPSKLRRLKAKSDLEGPVRPSWRHCSRANGLRRLLLEPPVAYVSPELCPDCNSRLVGYFDCNPFILVCWRCGFHDMETEVIALGL